jgi:hypothetical protein
VSYGVAASRMLRRALAFAIGNWDLANPGFTSILFETSCGQGLQVQLRYIPSRFPAFRTCYFPLCLSTLGRFGALSGIFALNHLPL